MSAQSSSFLVPIIIRVALNAVVVWALHRYVPQYFGYSGGVPGYILIGILLTIMNAVVRPLLNVIIFPLRLLAAALAIIAVNGAFVYITVRIIEQMDPSLVALQIQGGNVGWIVIAIAFGLSNWMMRFIVK